jgi:hypothetical protein
VRGILAQEVECHRHLVRHLQYPFKILDGNARAYIERDAVVDGDDAHVTASLKDQAVLFQVEAEIFLPSDFRVEIKLSIDEEVGERNLQRAVLGRDDDFAPRLILGLE